MKIDIELQKEAEDALHWVPFLQSSEMAVTAKNNVATITNSLKIYIKKKEKEKTVKNLPSIKSIIVKMDEKDGVSSSKFHNILLKEIINVLNTNWSIPKDSVVAKLDNGMVTLTGVVPWLYQKFVAQAFVGYVTGVKNVSNYIIVQSKLYDTIEQRDVEKALEQNWTINAKDINVKIDGCSARLSGIVSSEHQKEEAERMASKVSGILSVDNRLIVDSHPN